jgi:hypothetical protein
MACVRLGFIPPQLPSLSDQPPEGANWIHEVKHDGYRTMSRHRAWHALAYTRNGHDWSDRYPALLLRHASCHAGRQSLMARSLCRMLAVYPDFEALQAALRSQPSRLIFYAFDLLHLDARTYWTAPLSNAERKLLQLVRRDQEIPIQFSEEFIGDAAAFFRACAAHELEGIVSKLATSRYRAVEARLGSRLSALPKASLRFSASTATARPEPNVRSSPNQNVGSLSMQDQLSSPFVQKRVREFEARLAKLKQEHPSVLMAEES